jgi:hypothetical protein
MNGRKFLGTTAIGGGSLLGLPLRTEKPAPALGAGNAGERSLSTPPRLTGAGDSYEFSQDGKECLIKRYDTTDPLDEPPQ